VLMALRWGAGRYFFVALLLVNIISVHISTTSFIAPLEDLAMSLKHKIKVRPDQPVVKSHRPPVPHPQQAHESAGSRE
jgi:hypothetical protein